VQDTLLLFGEALRLDDLLDDLPDRPESPISRTARSVGKSRSL
jgi:hypothetical protein